MDENCPSCGNEIFKPYNYCNACGWEKKEKKQKKGQKKEKEDLEEKELDELEELEEFEELDEFEEYEELDESEIDTKGKRKETRSKRVEKGIKSAKKLDERKIEKQPSLDLEEEIKPIKITCKCGGVIKITSLKRPLKFRCPKCGKTGTLKGTEKVKGAGSQEIKPKSRARHEDYEKKETAKDRITSDLRERPRGPRTKKKVPRYEPPESAYVVKPVKGKCAWCGSRNLRYFDDGSGRCTNCGKDFSFGGDSSRIQKKEYYCQRCRKPLEYIEQYKRWYCYNCGEYA